MHDLYLRYYAGKDVLIPAALERVVGEVVTERALLDRKTYEGSEIYADLLRPHDIHHIMAAWLQRTPHACQALVIEAGRQHGPFDQLAVERYSAFVPHLVRVAQMREALAAARRGRDIGMEILDRLPFGILFLDRAGTVISATTCAEEMLRQRDGIHMRQSRVRAEHGDDDRRLQEAIFQSLRPSRADSAPGATVRIRRKTPKPALIAQIIPVTPSPVLTITPQPFAMLVITDPSRSPKSSADVFRDALRLTEAESRLAEILLTGASLREASQALGKSIQTCKTQLKSIYSKIGCRNHVELTKTLLMSAVAAGLGPG